MHSHHFMIRVLLAQAALHCSRSVYGTQAVTTGHPSGMRLVPENVAVAQHPNHE